MNDAFGRLWRLLSRRRRPPRIDPELERLAQRAFGELREAPLMRPSRDIAESVKQRLQQRAAEQPGPTVLGGHKRRLKVTYVEVARRLHQDMRSVLGATNRGGRST